MTTNLRHILRLLWVPRHLPAAAIEVSVPAAILAGLVAIELSIVMLAVGAGAQTNEPYPDFNHYLLVALQAVPWAALVGAPLTGLVAVWMVLLAWVAHDLRAKAALKVFALSPVPFLAPVLIYSCCVFVANAGSPGFGFHPGPKPAWVEWRLFAVLGSCFWLPVFLVGWFGLWFWATEKAGHHLRHRDQWPPVCEQCDYDLRGTIAAKRHECPECGATIPPEPLSARR